MVPNFAPFRQKSFGDCTRPLLPTQGLEHRPLQQRSRTQRVNLLASRTPVPSRCIGQGRNSKPSESGVKPHGKKSSGLSFRFPPGSRLERRRSQSVA
jgi:hypothetical protein